MFLLALLLAATPADGHLASVQTEVEASGPAGPLRGTMLSPAVQGAPVVVMIPGSGPTDRDGNSAHGLKPATLRLLAAGLVAEGIASVRIDKRGMFGSADATPDPNAVTIGNYADDVHAWSSSIRRLTGARCVWVLGHSEGGLVALAAADGHADICGLVLVATPGRPVGTILADQLKANPSNGPLLEEALSIIRKLEAGLHVDALAINPTLLPLFRPTVQDFLIDEMALDPAKLIQRVTQPVLIIQGERDLQVSGVDAKRLKAANPAAKLALIPNTNHVLKAVASEDRDANLATYADSDLPLSAGVVAIIGKFIRSGSGSGGS
jgi:pimeloyl-ACP methyl ester carboxylesterase